MTNAITNFEIYADEPAKLAEFYRDLFAWQVEQMPGIDYWRIQTGAAEGPALHGGVTYRAIADLNGWMLFRERGHSRRNGGANSIAWRFDCPPQDGRVPDRLVTIASDPAKNMFGGWQADPTAFPTPEPD